MKKNPAFEEIFQHTTNNDIEILNSEKCSCIFCRHTFDARSVQDWISDEKGVTAICPECGMDSLVGDASGFQIDRDTLKEINLEYYGEDYMEHHPEAAQTYCERYKEGKITHKKSNELLYIQYLAQLSRQGNAYATYDLASLLEYGTEFTEADPQTAFSYYMSKCLEGDGQALTRMGVLCESGVLGKEDPKGAYECYSKAMAFGAANGLLHFADCYVKGMFVEKNPTLAYEIYSNFYTDCYSRFVATTGKESMIFASLCYRMGKMYEEGQGVTRSAYNAIRFYLMADTAFVLYGENLMDGEIKSEFQDNFYRINKLANILSYKQDQPNFDVDTFSESLELNSYGNRGGFEGSYLTDVFYDEESQTASFTMVTEKPQLIVDAANLFTGFVAEPVTYNFNEVISAAAIKNDGQIPFNQIIGNTDEGFRFLMVTDGVEEVVAEFILGDPAAAEEEDDSKGLA